MATTVSTPRPVSSGHPPLIPERARPHGPVTASRLRRTGLGFIGLWTVAALALLVGATPAWKAFGLGLLVPGGGFIYTSDPVFAVLAVALFALALVAWFGSGNILAPPLVWVGAATLASLRVHTGLWSWAEPAIPAALAIAVVGVAIGQRVTFRAAQQRGRARNVHLAQVTWAEPSTVPATTLGPELSENDLAHQRFILDLALQPIESFEGFDWVEQFQTAAVRYQLNFACYSLAMAQFSRTPAFTGYVSEAQRNLIAKMTDKRVWGYWFYENLWGNLRLNPDPIPRDNIMLSGYMGLMLGMYESLTPDERFDEPGSLTFSWSDKREYPYDHHGIAGAVRANFDRYEFGMFPCEPNWIYSACNTFGINTLLTHDRLHGTGYTDEVIERFRHAVDVEFLTADGRVTAIRSSRLGLTIPALTSTMADAGTAFFLNPSLPDVAQRSWQLVRTELVSAGADREPSIQLRGWDKLDVGNYKLGTDVSARAIVAAAAIEMGDLELNRQLLDSADARFDPVVKDGARRYAKASTQANCFLGLGRFGRPDGFRDLIHSGLPDAWRTGPILAEAAYPDVLVARAVTDGDDLDLVLRPGRAPGRVTLGLARLVPGRTYRVTGGVTDELVAGVDGTARVEVDLDTRRAVRVTPAAA